MSTEHLMENGCGKISYFDAADEAVSRLNEECNELSSSLEYRIGSKVLDNRSILKGFHPIKVIKMLYHRHACKVLDKKIAKCNQPSNVAYEFDWDESLWKRQRIAVYTCITGGYDPIHEPIFAPDNVDFYIISDTKIPDDSSWEQIDFEWPESVADLDNTRRARYVKTHPHLLFPNYDVSIWVDGNLQIYGDPSKLLCSLTKRLPIATVRHSYRNCIYKEAEACSLYGKDKPEVMNQQMGKYRSEKMPEEYGLAETNVMVRRHNDRACKKIMEEWWCEIYRGSKRDQLSFPYVLWKNGYSIKDVSFFCRDARRYPMFRYMGYHD